MTGCKPQAIKRAFVALVRPHVEYCVAVRNNNWNSWLKKLKIQNELPDGSVLVKAKNFLVTTLWGDVHTTGVALSDHEENHPDLLSSFQHYHSMTWVLVWIDLNSLAKSFLMLFEKSQQHLYAFSLRWLCLYGNFEAGGTCRFNLCGAKRSTLCIGLVIHHSMLARSHNYRSKCINYTHRADHGVHAGNVVRGCFTTYQCSSNFERREILEER